LLLGPFFPPEGPNLVLSIQYIISAEKICYKGFFYGATLQTLAFLLDDIPTPHGWEISPSLLPSPRSDV
jgi:hypothetical protein